MNKPNLDIEKIKQLITDKPIIIHLLVPALIIMLYLFLFFIPKIKQTFLLLPQVKQLQETIVNTEREWANIGSFKQRISQLSGKIDYYEKRLPGEKEIPAILEYLSDSAKKLNVSITEIKPIEQGEDRREIYYSVPILLKAECGYHQLGRFLNKLEKADRFMKISAIKITSSSYNILQTELMIVTYVMTQK